MGGMDQLAVRRSASKNIQYIEVFGLTKIALNGNDSGVAPLASWAESLVPLFRGPAVNPPPVSGTNSAQL
jgi:hypothetical protein